MDNIQIGKLIRMLRIEKRMTQLDLAEQINVTDKAVSKWERGAGSPDISLLPVLSQTLGVNIEEILSGGSKPNEKDSRNMRRIKFYVCPDCASVLTSTGESEVFCCGRKLSKLECNDSEISHKLTVEKIENDYYITMPHEMTCSHHISFMAYVTPDKMLLTMLYPEQDAAVRIPRMNGGMLFYYCTQHGLFVEKSLK